jgi:hypothetical protein
MDEDNQSFVPESFVALFVKPGHYKPSLLRTEILKRYELCEDLANMLQDTISTQQFQLGITENDALKTCWQGLLAQPELVLPEEAFWVVCRLAELLSWPIPEHPWP